jgi:hypothetical protein
MKVVCINNSKLRGKEIPFTIGKVYETKGGPSAQYSIMSDDGMIYELSTSRFIDLEEWREKQLDKILL